MPCILPDSSLNQLSEFVRSNIGLYFPPNRYKDLERGIESAAKDLGFKETISCVNWLLSSHLTKDRLDTLAGYLTIGETYFFRDKKLFQVLKQNIIQDIIQSRWTKEKSLRIWSAGCCTGEEAYTIAMVIDELLPQRKDWNITVIATDINERFLEKARQGLYTQWSFRDVPQTIVEKYFQSNKGQLEISPQVKSIVTFFPLNLAEAKYPSVMNNTHSMDIIFCRNVLMYFSPELREKVINHMSQCLKIDGYLIVSPGEAENARLVGLEPIRLSGTTLYKKRSEGKITSNSSTTILMDFIATQKNNNQYSGVSKAIVPATIVSTPVVSALSIQADRAKDSSLLQPLSVNTQLSQQPAPLIPKNVQNDNSKPDLYQEALTLYEKGRYADASDKLLQILSINSSDINSMKLLAKAYANQRKAEDAKKWCAKAINEDKLDPGMYYLMATIYHEQGILDESTKCLRQALYLDPDFLIGYFMLGNITLKQNKINEAKKHFKNTMSLLNNMNSDDIIPYSDGITAGRLTEIVKNNLTD